MDFSICADCGVYFLGIRLEDLILALTISGAVMIGHRMSCIARSVHRFPTVASIVAFATAGAAVLVWILTSWGFLLPFAGFLIGRFHQRASLLTLSLSALPRSVPGSE
jgi:hypothetical protein